MNDNVFTFIVGGKAGEGVKKAGTAAAHLFQSMGRHVFQMDDYQSLIRGGHNFSVVSTAVREITSHYMKANLAVAFDARSFEMHQDHLLPDGMIVFNSEEPQKAEGNAMPMPLKSRIDKDPEPGLRLGVSAIAVLAAAIGLDKESLAKLIRAEYKRDLEINLAHAMNVYAIAHAKIPKAQPLERGNSRLPIITGNEAIGLGAFYAGLDAYIGYPMTPSSSLLHFLARYAGEFHVTVVHPENEIAVANMAIGAAFAGARTMVGSSGGGFALMEEAISLAGMTETPLLCLLSSRPGPSTGVPTYTAQGDLRFALNQGHGEFPRLVASPGSIGEAFHLAADMLDLVWRFQTPGILLTEKHLSECSMTANISATPRKQIAPLMHGKGEYKRYLDTDDGVSPLLFPPSPELIKWNSYEHDESGLTTEEPDLIVRMHDKRNRKAGAMKEFLKGMRTVNVFNDGTPTIFTYGSTTMSVLEALRFANLDAKVVQPIYLEPFPVWAMPDVGDGECIVVEMSSTGQFANLLKEKAGIIPKKVIKKYDGRPFSPEELAIQIKGAL